jgi:TM2 domain-containing membrane protein YozV
MTNETVGQPGVPLAPSIAPAAPSVAPSVAPSTAPPAPSYIPGGPVAATAADMARMQAPPYAGASTISNDARALMMYEQGKKSMMFAYAFWWVLGFFGAHRFYAKGAKAGFLQLGVFTVLFFLALALIGNDQAWGMALWLVIPVWWVVDAFLIPGWISTHNNALIAQFGGR